MNPLSLLIPQSCDAIDAQVYGFRYLNATGLKSVLYSVLSREEKARAGRFVFEKDRRRYMAVRGMLRYLLAEILALDPGQLEFSYSPRGRPLLKACPELSFNVSHSKDLSLLACSFSGKIGVDIEDVDRNCSFEDMALECLSPRETRQWQGIKPARRQQAFFRCWVQKEACLKAYGLGITAGLRSLSVDIDPDGPGGILEGLEVSDSVRMHLWQVEKGTLAALCHVATREI